MGTGMIETRLFNGEVKKLTRTTIAIDPEKLRRELAKRQLGIKLASLELGYSHSTLGNTIKFGIMTTAMAKALELAYNIRQEDIVYREPEPVAEKKPEQTRITEHAAEEVKQETHQVDVTQIYHAVKSAFSDAIREAEEEKAEKAKSSKNDAEYVLIYRAVLDAINQAVKINIKELRGAIYAANTSAIRVNVRKDYLNNE